MKEILYGLFLGKKICLDQWGDAILSTDVKSIEEWCGTKTLIKNGAIIKIAKVE